MTDVTALGELLIDFTYAGRSAAGQVLYEQNPGGAPANVLTAVVRQGGSGALLSCVGDDGFGLFLRDTVEGIGIDAAGIQVTEEAATTLAFVSLDQSGDRSFTFCRKPGADQLIRMDRIDMHVIESTRIFHFGSLSLSRDPSRDAAFSTAKYAKERGKLVSYDPNWREPLWPSVAAGVEGMRAGLAYADLVKLSHDELRLLSGSCDLHMGCQALLDEYPQIVLTVVTLGTEGCFYTCRDASRMIPSYRVEAVDTTGAGDAFWGTLLFHIARDPGCLDEGHRVPLEQYLKIANAAGALCTTGRGAIPSIPDAESIEKLMKKKDA
jgi:fructokinase